MVGYGPNQDSLARVVAIGTDLAIDGIDMDVPRPVTWTQV